MKGQYNAINTGGTAVSTALLVSTQLARVPSMTGSKVVLESAIHFRQRAKISLKFK